MATKREIEQLLALTAVRYPAFALTSEIVAAYCEDLADLPAREIDLALKQLRATNRFFPAVAEIRDAVRSLHREADNRPDAGAAWRELSHELHIGANGFEWRPGAIERLHPLVVQAAREFGERRFVERLVEEAGTDFAQFERIYNALARRADQAAQMIPEVRRYIADLAKSMSASRAAALAAPAIEPRSEAAQPTLAGALQTIQKKSPRAQAQDKRAKESARLRALADDLERQIRGETDSTKREAMAVRLAGLRRSVGVVVNEVKS